MNTKFDRFSVGFWLSKRIYLRIFCHPSDMKASHVQRLATRILEFRGSISTLNCGFRAVEKSGTAVWYDVAESSKYGSPMWNRCFSSLLGRRAGVALGSRGIGCTVKSILEVPSSVQPFSRCMLLSVLHIVGIALCTCSCCLR